MIDVFLFLMEDLCIILSAILVVRLLVLNLKIYQDCRYQLKLSASKHLSFLKKNPMILIFIPFLFVLHLWYMQIVFLVYGIYYWIKLRQKRFIRKLRWTPRIIRQSLVLLLGLTVLGTFLMMWIKFSSLQALLMFYAILAGLFVWITGAIMTPVEYGVLLYYKEMAKRKLKKYRPTVIGITGSCGKTTVKNMVFHLICQDMMTEMSEKSYNTVNGLSLTINNYLDKENLVLVLEMGATKVGDIQELVEFCSPEVGIITEISPQHLGTFHTVENIVREKMKLIENLTGRKLAILNYDNPKIREYQVESKVDLVTVGSTPDCTYYATEVMQSLEGISFKVRGKKELTVKTKLLGSHQVTNLLCAIALALEFGVTVEAIEERILTLQPVSNRLSLKKASDITIIDDSYNSNPSGFVHALEVLSFSKEKKTLITPGIVEAGSKTEEINKTLATEIARVCDEVILIDNLSARFIAQGLTEVGYSNFRIVDKFEKARSLVTEGCLLIENDLPDQYFI